LQIGTICPSHHKLENKRRIGVAVPLIHPGARSLRHVLAVLLSRKTLGNHCAGRRVGTGTTTVGSEEFLLLGGSYNGLSNLMPVLGADFISCSKVKPTLLIFLLKPMNFVTYSFTFYGK
jgi:hypothetical protein